MTSELIVRRLGIVEYKKTRDDMERFTRQRDQSSQDELWLLEHLPVFTLGRAGDPAHLLRQSDIPLLRTDRGGQITYHGPGQLVAYLLFDLKRMRVNVRQLVEKTQNGIIDLLKRYAIFGETRPKAPGVYVHDAKIAALGFRIIHQRSLHGCSINLREEAASPFALINPCGMPGLPVTSIEASLPQETPSTEQIATQLASNLKTSFGYHSKIID